MVLLPCMRSNAHFPICGPKIETKWWNMLSIYDINFLTAIVSSISALESLQMLTIT